MWFQPTVTQQYNVMISSFSSVSRTLVGFDIVSNPTALIYIVNIFACIFWIDIVAMFITNEDESNLAYFWLLCHFICFGLDLPSLLWLFSYCWCSLFEYEFHWLYPFFSTHSDLNSNKSISILCIIHQQYSVFTNNLICNAIILVSLITVTC